MPSANIPGSPTSPRATGRAGPSRSTIRARARWRCSARRASSRGDEAAPRRRHRPRPARRASASPSSAMAIRAARRRSTSTTAGSTSWSACATARPAPRAPPPTASPPRRSTRRCAAPTSSCCSPPTRRSPRSTARSSRTSRHGAALGFSHGLAIRFGQIVPRADLDVIMVAPKGPGTALRSLYRRGQGHGGAVRRRAGRQRRRRGARARLWPRARLRPRRADRRPASPRNATPTCSTRPRWCGARCPKSSSPGFDTLVEAGISEEVAYMECVGELKLLADLIEARGIAAMREAISNTAELGAVTGGPRIVDERVRARDARDPRRNPQRRLCRVAVRRSRVGLSLAHGRARRGRPALPVERARTSQAPARRLADRARRLAAAAGARPSTRARYSCAGACGAPRPPRGPSPPAQARLLRRHGAR